MFIFSGRIYFCLLANHPIIRRMTNGQIARIASETTHELLLVFNGKVKGQRIYPSLLLIYTLREIAANPQLEYHLATLVDVILGAAEQDRRFCYDSICQTIYHGR